MRGVLLLASCLAVLAAAATPALAASVSETKKVPGKLSGQPPFYELNLGSLTPGEQLDYTWGTRTTGSLYFDVHYHDGAKVQYLVDREQGTSKSERITVPAGHRNLSFLWENSGNADVEIAYEVKSVAQENATALPVAPFAAAAALALAGLAGRRRR